ncbi:MAG: Crp/Fnr family transcriptional regulator [Clostridia bacterium]|nr:Crp/Fnr family transcriptional regulator [Clostridia bacterium]
MRKYLPQLRQCPLFARIPDEDLLRTLVCLRVQVICVQRDQVILRQGEPAARLGVVLCGGVRVVSSDEYGNHSVIVAVGEREVFADSFACAGLAALPVSVVASQESVVLLLEHKRVITGCRNGCMAHSYLVTNLLRIIAGKNLILSRKLSIVTQRTTREKLLAFLREQQKQSGMHRFTIPFDRQALADYLGVERSAMSAELGRMKRAGLIDYRKNEFEILRPSGEAHGEKLHG